MSILHVCPFWWCDIHHIPPHHQLKFDPPQCQTPSNATDSWYLLYSNQTKSRAFQTKELVRTNKGDTRVWKKCLSIGNHMSKTQQLSKGKSEFKWVMWLINDGAFCCSAVVGWHCSRHTVVTAQTSIYLPELWGGEYISGSRGHKAAHSTLDASPSGAHTHAHTHTQLQAMAYLQVLFHLTACVWENPKAGYKRMFYWVFYLYNTCLDEMSHSDSQKNKTKILKHEQKACLYIKFFRCHPNCRLWDNKKALIWRPQSPVCWEWGQKVTDVSKAYLVLMDFFLQITCVRNWTKICK